MYRNIYQVCAVAGVVSLVMSIGGCLSEQTPAASGNPAATTPPGALAAPSPVTTPAQGSVTTAPGETVSRTIEDGGTGAYKAILVGDSSLSTHSIFRPRDLSAFGPGRKLPILTWGNGACANSPNEHLNFLSEVASHGYLVIAIGPPPQGGRGGGGSSTSRQLLDAVDWALAQNDKQDSIYRGKIDTAKIAAAGMSCGGLQALEVSADQRITTTMVCNSGIIGAGGRGGRGAAPGGATGPMPDQQDLFLVVAQAGPGPAGRGAMPGAMPGGRGAAPGAGGARGGMGGMPSLSKDHLTRLHAPILYLLGGTSDMAYENGMDDFRRIERLPAFVANMDVGHGGTYMRPHGGEFAKVAVAWLNWQLKGDTESGRMFTGNPPGLSSSSVWTFEKKNIP